MTSTLFDVGMVGNVLLSDRSGIEVSPFLWATSRYNTRVTQARLFALDSNGI